jgi:putative aldouronate transport system permease protein
MSRGIAGRSENVRYLRRLYNYRHIILMILPVITVLIVFSYIPMAGNILAFKEFSVRKGIWRSEWVGMKYFNRLWNMPAFWRVFTNQIEISLMKLLIGFPYPIMLALAVNELRSSKQRRIYQTTYTFPHFLSWIVVSGVIIGFLADQGIINQVLIMFGRSKHRILTDGNQFRIMLYVTEIWKEGGWSSILYIAALASINQELYEASAIDGANRWQQMWYITIPGILPTASVLLVLSAGSILSGGFDQIINLYNDMVMHKADIIDTYIYRTAISKGMDFSYATAVGMFKSIVNITLLLIANYTIRFMGQETII